MITTHTPARSRFSVDPTSCAVLIEARSTVGAVRFGSTEISGIIEVVRAGDVVDTRTGPRACLTIPLASLSSGNALYDAELQQRLAVRRFPVVTLELVEATLLAGCDYRVTGTMSIHGVTATMSGGVSFSFPAPGSVLVTGEHLVDIRDFNIEIPSVLMLRIYPEVKVSLYLRATQSESGAES